MDTRLVHLLLSMLIFECSVVPYSLNEFLSISELFVRLCQCSVAGVAQWQ